MRDIVFEQNYAKRVGEHTQQVAQQAFMSGRQQGWNDLLFIVAQMQAAKIEVTPDTMVKELQKFLNSQQQETEESKEEKKPALSVVK